MLNFRLRIYSPVRGAAGKCSPQCATPPLLQPQVLAFQCNLSGGATSTPVVAGSTLEVCPGNVVPALRAEGVEVQRLKAGSLFFFF